MREPEPCVLALDLGSSSLRAVVYDAAGRLREDVPTVQLAYAWTATSDGGMETTADALFALTVQLLDRCVEGVRAAGATIAAVGVATFWHSLLGVGADGAPLTPVYGWGDLRAAGAALRLRERVDEAAVHARTGCFLHPSYPSARLLWLRDAAGDTFPRVRGWVSFGEYLELRLFGVRRCSLSMASGTGLLDLARCAWDAEMLAAVGIGAGALSPLVDTDAPGPALFPDWARRWPELAGAVWVPPVGDGACANVGSGAVGAGRVGVTVGTSAAVRALWQGEPVAVPPGVWCYRLDRRRLVMGRALSNAGNAAAWLRRTLLLPPAEELEAAAAAMEPDAHGLTVVPTLLGERAPGWERWSGAATLGLRQATQPVEIFRAWMEAVAFRIADALDALEGALGPTERILASGGALHASPTWTGILADVLGRTVTLDAVAEATSRGAALVALERIGLAGAREAASPPDGAAFAADPARHARYRAARERQRRAEALLDTREST